MFKRTYRFFLNKLRNALRIPTLEAQMQEGNLRVQYIESLLKAHICPVPPLFNPEHCNLVSSLSEVFISTICEGTNHRARKETSLSEQSAPSITIIDYEPELWADRLFQSPDLYTPDMSTVKVSTPGWMKTLSSIPESDFILIPSSFLTATLLLNEHTFAHLSQKTHRALLLAMQFTDEKGFSSITTSIDGDRKLRTALHENGFLHVSLLNAPSPILSNSRQSLKNTFTFTSTQDPEDPVKGKANEIPVKAIHSIPLVYGARRL